MESLEFRQQSCIFAISCRHINAFPQIDTQEDDDLMDVLYSISESTGDRIVMIIDEWDALTPLILPHALDSIRMRCRLWQVSITHLWKNLRCGMTDIQ